MLPISNNILMKILTHSPQGLSEYELIKKLEGAGCEQISTHFVNEFTLFQQHFLLFNSLYQLRNELIKTKQGYLEISALKIIIYPWQEKSSQSIGEYDYLSEYYLDMNNLRETTEEDVDQLLSSFWLKYVQYDDRASALGVLGLTDPVDQHTIKQKYRRLVMKHHPDRGGSTEQIQRIKAAMDRINGR